MLLSILLVFWLLELIFKRSVPMALIGIFLHSNIGIVWIWSETWDFVDFILSIALRILSSVIEMVFNSSKLNCLLLNCGSGVDSSF